MPIRLAFLNTHPIQYKAPLYAYLNATLDFDVTALYMSDFSIRGSADPGFQREVKWDVDLLSGYRPVFLGDAAKKRQLRGFFSMLAPELWREVRDGGYDALVIHGHNLMGHHVALMAARSIGLPVFMRCETHLGLTRPKAQLAVRRPILGALYACFDGFLAIGSGNIAFYQAMGVPLSKISLVPYTVDNSRIAAAANMPPDERRIMRANWGVFDDRPIILFAAKFQRRKHPDDLIRACQRLAAEGLPFHLAMVGSGEMELELRGLAATLPSESVGFHGFLNQSELPRAYGASDVFVLPSSNEPWGLAINEAMAAGLPIVASREIGAVADIVRDGVNGFIFEARDVEGLLASLRELVGKPNLRSAMSRASREIITGWSYEQCSTGIRKAIGAVRKSATEVTP